MTSIQIPLTEREAFERLEGIEALLTAKGWERAAIVAAFVRLPETEYPKPYMRSPREFAQIGIKGLASHDTVSNYARAWLARYELPVPGALVSLPTDPWPGLRRGSDGYDSEEGLQATIERAVEKHGAEVVAAAVTVASPAAAEAITNATIEERVENLPPAPFPDVPKPVPDHDEIEAAMDARKLMGNIEHTIKMAALHYQDHPEAWNDQLALRAVRAGESLGTLAALIRGLSDSDVAELLGASS